MPSTKHAILKAVSEYPFREGIDVNSLYSDAKELKPELEIRDFDRTLIHLVKNNFLDADNIKMDTDNVDIGIPARIKRGFFILTMKGDLEI